MGLLPMLLAFLRALFASRASRVAENMALRQQWVVLQRTVKSTKLRKRDRIFWAWLSRLWPGWRSALLVMHPATMIEWHRLGFRLY